MPGDWRSPLPRTFGRVVIAAIFLSCSGTPESPLAPFGEAVKLTVSPTTLGLAIGGSERLSAIAWDARNRYVLASVTWSTSDASVATVGSNDGVVSAVRQGSVIVTATSGPFTASATVTVVEIHGTLVFTRTTYASTGVRFDALFWSASDGGIRAVPRDPRFSNIAAPVWSPDGTQLALEGIDGPIVYDWDSDWYWYPSDVYVANPADSVSPWRAVTRSGASRSPDWSPDGNRIAYVSGPSFGAADVLLIDAAGGTPMRLTSESGAYETPRWSPDGTRLAYAKTGRIYISDADGTGLTAVYNTFGYWDHAPSWSADGTQLAWVRSDDRGVASLVVALMSNLVDPHTVFVAPSGTWITAPVWSPDGKWIALSNNGVLSRGILAINLAEPAKVQLTTPAAQYLDRPSAWKR